MQARSLPSEARGDAGETLSVQRQANSRRRNLPVNTLELARYLIGKTLVHDLPAGRLSGRIVETEGYPPGDAAGRSFRGKTPSNQSLFLRRGYCHIYFTYGSSFMVNVTSEEPGIGAGCCCVPWSRSRGVTRCAFPQYGPRPRHSPRSRTLGPSHAHRHGV